MSVGVFSSDFTVPSSTGPFSFEFSDDFDTGNTAPIVASDFTMSVEWKLKRVFGKTKGAATTSVHFVRPPIIIQG